MISSLLYYLLGGLRVLAGTLLCGMGVGFAFAGDIENPLFKGLGYLGATAIGLLLIAWGYLYFKTAEDQDAPYPYLVVLALLTWASIISFAGIMTQVNLDGGGVPAVLLFGPALFGMAVVSWGMWLGLRPQKRPSE